MAYIDLQQTWDLSKILHRRNFRLKPSISPNFNSFSDKTPKKKSENGEIYTAGQKFYTAAGSDDSDKSHLWPAMTYNGL